MVHKTIGIIGLGKNGQVFARICLGFRMRVLAHDLEEVAMDNVEMTELDTLMSESDIISLHCPLNQASLHLIDKHQMEKGVVLIDTGRGGLINEDKTNKADLLT